MEYFKVINDTGKEITEINRDKNGDFNIVITSGEKKIETAISPTEAKDLSEFIQKKAKRKRA